MKALQNNSEWISQVYEQGTGEGNWKVADVSFKQSREAIKLANADTSTTNLSTVRQLTSVPDGTPFTLTVGGSEVSYSTSQTNVDLQDNWATITGAYPVGTKTEHNNASFYNGTCAIFNADGTRFYTFQSGETFAEYEPPLPFDPIGNSAEGSTLLRTFDLTLPSGTTWDSLRSSFGSNITNYKFGDNGRYSGNFSNDGTKFFNYTRDYMQVMFWDLSTPFDLSTATYSAIYDIGDENTAARQAWYDAFGISSNSGAKSGWTYYGIGYIKFDDTGTKGFLFKRSGTSPGNAYNNWDAMWATSFVLSTPYDLSSVTSATRDNNVFPLGSNQEPVAFWVSDDGTSAIAKVWQSTTTGYVYQEFTTPFVVTSEVDYQGGTIIPTTSKNDDDFDSPAGDTSSLVVSNDGDFFYTEHDRNDNNGKHFVRVTGMLSDAKIVSTVNYDTSGLSLASAPTAAVRDFSPPDVSIQAQTRAAFNKEFKTLAIDNASTYTSLNLYPDVNISGSQALQTGDTLLIDGQSVTTGTVSYNASAYNHQGTATYAPRAFTKAAQLESGNRPYLAQTHSFDRRLQTEHRNSASFTQGSFGFCFSHDGTRLWLPSRGTNYAFGDTSIVDGYWIEEYALSTAWDMSTASEVTAIEYDNGNNFPVNQGSNINMDFSFSPDGTKFYANKGYSTGSRTFLNQYTCATPYDLSSLTLDYVLDFYTTSAFDGSNRRYYSHHFSEDGRMVVFGTTTSSFTLSNDLYLTSAYCTLSTPFDLSTVGTPTYVANPNRMLQPAIIGNSTLGYYVYGFENSGRNGDRAISFYGISGNGTSKGDDEREFYLPTYPPGGWSQRSEYHFGGKMYDNGNKLFVYYPESHTIRMFVGPYSPVNDRYTVDVTSASLTSLPDEVKFPRNTTYDSLGTPTISSSTSSERTYAYTSKSLDAEALRFKIDGDEGDEIKQLNVDLFTS